MPEHTRKRLLSTLGLALSGTAITLTLMGCGEDKPATQTEGSHSAGHAEAAAEQTHDIGGLGLRASQLTTRLLPTYTPQTLLPMCLTANFTFTHRTMWKRAYRKTITAITSICVIITCFLWKSQAVKLLITA